MYEKVNPQSRRAKISSNPDLIQQLSPSIDNPDPSHYDKLDISRSNVIQPRPVIKPKSHRVIRQQGYNRNQKEPLPKYEHRWTSLDEGGSMEGIATSDDNHEYENASNRNDLSCPDRDSAWFTSEDAPMSSHHANEDTPPLAQSSPYVSDSSPHQGSPSSGRATEGMPLQPAISAPNLHRTSADFQRNDNPSVHRHMPVVPPLDLSQLVMAETSSQEEDDENYGTNGSMNNYYVLEERAQRTYTHESRREYISTGQGKCKVFFRSQRWSVKLIFILATM